MSKLKVLLQPVGERWILFQVLEMDERFRIMDSRFGSSNGIKVSSVVTPNLEPGHVWLWGEDGYDDETPCLCTYPGVKSRDTAMTEILEALTDWAANWSGWGDSEKPVENGGDIYEF